MNKLLSTKLFLIIVLIFCAKCMQAQTDLEAYAIKEEAYAKDKTVLSTIQHDDNSFFNIRQRIKLIKPTEIKFARQADYNAFDGFRCNPSGKLITYLNWTEYSAGINGTELSKFPGGIENFKSMLGISNNTNSNELINLLTYGNLYGVIRHFDNEKSYSNFIVVYIPYKENIELFPASLPKADLFLPYILYYYKEGFGLDKFNTIEPLDDCLIPHTVCPNEGLSKGVPKTKDFTSLKIYLQKQKEFIATLKGNNIATQKAKESKEVSYQKDPLNVAFKKKNGFYYDSKKLLTNGFYSFVVDSVYKFKRIGIANKEHKIVVPQVFTELDTAKIAGKFFHATRVPEKGYEYLYALISLDDYKMVMPISRKYYFDIASKNYLSYSENGKYGGVYNYKTNKIIVPAGSYEKVGSYLIDDQEVILLQGRDAVQSKTADGSTFSRWQGMVVNDKLVLDRKDIYYVKIEYDVFVVTSMSINDLKQSYANYYFFSKTGNSLGQYNRDNYEGLQEWLLTNTTEGRKEAERRERVKQQKNQSGPNSNPSSMSGKFTSEVTEYLDLYKYFNSAFNLYKANQSEVYNVRNWLNKLIDKNTTVINILRNSNDGSMSSTEQAQYLKMAEQKAEELRKFSDNLGKSSISILEAIAIGLARGARQ